MCVCVQPPQLSKKEIEELLKKGAYGALMEGNDDDANRYTLTCNTRQCEGVSIVMVVQVL